MWGVVNHVSDPNRITAYTTTLKKFPDTCIFSHSHPKIPVIRDHFLRAFQRLLATAGQSLSEAVKIFPRYLKDGTEVSGWTYSRKGRSVIYCRSSAASLHHFCSASFLHCDVLGWRPFKAVHGTSMSQRVHRGWGCRVPPPQLPWCPALAGAVSLH